MEQSRVLISTFEYAYSQSLGIEGARKVIEKAVNKAGLTYKDVLSHDEALKIYEQLKNEEGFIRSIAACLTILLTPEVQALIIKIKELEENIAERIRAEEALCLIQGELEKRVEERTVDLLKTNQQLALEMSERNQIGETLRRSEERFRLAARNASDFIYDWDIASGELTWFGNIDKNLGYEPGEFPRTIEAWEKAIHPEDHAAVTQRLGRHLKTREPYEIDYRLIRKDGEVVYWTNRGTAIRDEHGEAVRMYGACTDISARKKAEIALQESGQRLSDIIGFLPDATFVIDTEGKVISWNRAMEEMTGVKAQDVIGKGNYEYSFIFYGERKPVLIDLVVKPDAKMEKEYSSLQKEKNMLVAESFIPNFREKGIYIWAKAAPLYDKNNNIVGAIEAVRDITLSKQRQMELNSAYEELKRTQTQLIQGSKMAALGQLAGGVAHEINNPLTGVLNNVQLIKLTAAKNKEFSIEEFRELLDIIEESALRCKKITQSLLDITHVAKGQLQPVNLNSLVDKVLGIVSTEMRLANISIQNEPQPNLAVIQGDSQLLQQVILGLIANAKWAIDKKTKGSGGIITIKTWQDPKNKRIFLLISDDGIGIPNENLNRLFEPFFTTKEVGEGTGLGLALIYNIIKNHGGNITAASQVDAGTTFTINFPSL